MTDRTEVVHIVIHRSVALGDQNTGGFGGIDRRNLSQNVFLVGIDAVGNNVVQLSRTPGLDVNDLAGAVKEGAARPWWRREGSPVPEAELLPITAA